MKKYLRVYKRILIFNLSMLLSYRANFINSVISSIAWGIFSILSIVLLTSKTPFVFGWKREELFILTGCYGIIVGFFNMLFSSNFERFSRIINRGELDLVLTKPMDPQFLLSVWILNYTSILRIILGILFVFYIAQENGVLISAIQVLVFIISSVFGLLVLYSIWFLVMSITIWFSRLSNLTDFMHSFMGYAGRPPEMFKEFSVYVFVFLLPLTFAVAMPTKFFLSKIAWQDLWPMPAFSIGIFYASRLFWRFALRFYTSAGG